MVYIRNFYLQVTEVLVSMLDELKKSQRQNDFEA